MKQAKVLTVAERKRLLAIIANDRHSERNRLAVMLSFLAGLRVGEIAALKVSDIVDGEDRVRDQLRLNPDKRYSEILTSTNKNVTRAYDGKGRRLRVGRIRVNRHSWALH